MSQLKSAAETVPLKIHAQLDDLIQQSRLLAEAQQATLTDHDRLSLMRRELQNIVEQGNLALAELYADPSIAFSDRLAISSEMGSFVPEPLPEALKVAVRTHLADRVRERDLDQACTAYRMTGVAFYPLNDSTIAVQLETFYKNRYFETYYMFLEFDSKSRRFGMTRHTLPHFIPAADLAKDVLPRDVQLFLSRISQLLIAYVSRREQVAELKSSLADGILLRADVSVSADLWDISLQSGVEIKAMFDSLDASHPSECMILHGPTGQRLAEAEAALLNTTTLAEVVQQFALDDMEAM
jgi:hypothetical protein